MQIQDIIKSQAEPSRYRVIRGFEGIVRIDISKAHEAMKHAMEVRKKLREADAERTEFISSHVK
jgi:hypothetical protein